MKTYRPPRKVIAAIEQLIATTKPSPHPPSVLVRVTKLLCETRNYERAGIFLTVNGREVPRAFSGPAAGANSSGATLSVPIKIASRTLGSVRVESPNAEELGVEDRVLLHEVAEILARYLTGKGKYLARKARETVRESTFHAETRGYQPSSERSSTSMETRRAAAGETSSTAS